MARGNDYKPTSPNGQGYDMVTRAPKAFTHASVAEGIHSAGVASGSAATASPGAALGTGSNTDRYTPGIEAV